RPTPAARVCKTSRRPWPSSPIAVRRTVGASRRARFSAMFRAAPPKERRTTPALDEPGWKSLLTRPLMSKKAAPTSTTGATSGVYATWRDWGRRENSLSAIAPGQRGVARPARDADHRLRAHRLTHRRQFLTVAAILRAD